MAFLSDEGLASAAAPHKEILTAFLGPWMIPGKSVQSLASCQLGDYESVLAKAIYGLTGGHEKICGVLVQGCVGMNDVGLEGSGVAWMETVSAGRGVAPF